MCNCPYLNLLSNVLKKGLQTKFMDLLSMLGNILNILRSLIHQIIVKLPTSLKTKSEKVKEKKGGCLNQTRPFLAHLTSSSLPTEAHLGPAHVQLHLQPPIPGSCSVSMPRRSWRQDARRRRSSPIRSPPPPPGTLGSPFARSSSSPSSSQ
jgi:hypothetical protein